MGFIRVNECASVILKSGQGKKCLDHYVANLYVFSSKEFMLKDNLEPELHMPVWAIDSKISTSEDLKHETNVRVPILTYFASMDLSKWIRNQLSM